MKRDQLLKQIMMYHIQDQRILVLNACENELHLFKEYLLQIKENYERLDINKLTQINESIQKRGLR